MAEMFDWVFGAVCFIVLPLAGIALLARWLMARHHLTQAAQAPSWADLTDGALTLLHEGRLITFWASGRPHRGSPRDTAPATFVAIDEVAFVAVDLLLWPKRPDISWFVRDVDRPIFKVKRSWLGPAIVEEERGMMLEWRTATVDQVIANLRSLGWAVEDHG